MFQKIKLFMREWGEWGRFKALPKKESELVFYAEAAGDWSHFETIIDSLTIDYNQSLCYLTSDSNDAVLKTTNPKIKPFYIGKGTVCTMAFKTIETKVFVITLLDLDRFHLKRSSHDVKYIYAFHSLTSTHVAFRDMGHHGYDTMLCSGPHHLQEIKKAEEVYGLKPKKLIEGGYCRLDSIYNNKRPKKTNGPHQVLIAPSWGESCISLQCAEPLIEILLTAGLKTIFRPHPMDIWNHKDVMDRINNKFQDNPLYVFETNICGEDSLHDSDLMISDWSGAALEYAFGLEKPVLYIDTPRKINNKNHTDIDLPAIEDFIREEIGEIVAMNELEKVVPVAKDMINNYGKYKDKILESRSKWIYNLGGSGKVGAQEVLNQLQQ